MFQLPPLTPFVKKLLIVIAGSVVTTTLLAGIVGIPVDFWLLLLPPDALSQVGLGYYAWLWQVVTHAFVYPVSSGAVISALVSGFFLYLMGSQFELRAGASVLFRVIVVSILASGLGGVVGVMILPTKFIGGMSPMLIGIICAMAASMPLDTKVNFFGVLPMTQKTILIAFGALIVLTSVADQNFGVIVSEFAAGGAAYFYMKHLLKPRAAKKPAPKPNGSSKKKKRSVPPGFRVIEGGGGGDDDDERPRYLN